MEANEGTYNGVPAGIRAIVSRSRRSARSLVSATQPGARSGRAAKWSLAGSWCHDPKKAPRGVSHGSMSPEVRGPTTRSPAWPSAVTSIAAVPPHLPIDRESTRARSRYMDRGARAAIGPGKGRRSADENRPPQREVPRPAGSRRRWAPARSRATRPGRRHRFVTGVPDGIGDPDRRLIRGRTSGDDDGRAERERRPGCRMTSLFTRTQPCDTVVPMVPGSLVPWIAIWPSPPANSLSVLLWPDRPIANTPYAVPGCVCRSSGSV